MNRQENWRETRGSNTYSDNSRPLREFNRFEGQGVEDNRRFDDRCRGGIDFMKKSKLTLDFDKKSLIIPDEQIKQMPKVKKPVEIHLSDTNLSEGQKQTLRDLFNSFKGLFLDQPGLTHVLYHEIYTGDQGPLVSRPYRYDSVKQGIIDYHIEKMLQEGPIRPIQSPYASPVFLTRKNNGLPPDSREVYRFSIDYHKRNDITKYPRYPLPAIDDLIINIPHTSIMSTLDFKSGYFQLAISPKNIEKTAVITRNGTFAFLRMPFGLSGPTPNFQKAIDIIWKPVIGPTPNFQKAIDIIWKPVIGRFVMAYMDDVIITSPSFNEHINHLNQAFTLFRDADICEPLYRLKKKKAKFNSSTEAYDAFNKVKRALTEAPVLQSPNFQQQFNLFTDASGFGIGAMLNQNHIPFAFASRTLNKTARNYTVTERECLAVI
ncbi:retrovirus-related Pol polyprotein from transposon opus [Trichonephila clavipes]|nr:retrovirus-related Pol polyprotein from transposon opus [Trichonephila clavipes]